MKTPQIFSWKVLVAWIALALPGGVCLGQLLPDPTANLLKNSSFEKGPVGWDLHTSGEKPRITKDTKQSHDGHPSIRIDQPKEADAGLDQEVTVKPNTRYRLSGWIKTENIIKPEGPQQRSGDAGASLTVTGGYDQTPFVLATTDWTFGTLDFSSGSKTKLRVGPRMGHYGKLIKGTAWFSDLSLVEVGPAPAVAVARPNIAPPGSSTVRIDRTRPNTPAEDFIFGELVKNNHDNLIVVSGANGSGSGFVAGLNGVNYVFTNAHVAAKVKGAEFKKLDGTKVDSAAPFAAVDHDIFRLTAPAGGKPFEIMDHVEGTAAIGDAVVVLGNAEGAGVINTIKGKIVGIGPNLVEVDAPFVPGNSGSPIIHVTSGKVIGVATYAIIKRFDANALSSGMPVIRRFGYRLDSVKNWQPVNWNAFAAQAAEMDGIEQTTNDLGRLLADVATNHKITPGLHTNPALKMPIDLWTTDQGRKLSPSDKAMAQQNFVSRIKSACQSDVAAARPQLTYDYFQRQLSTAQRERDSIAEAVPKVFGIAAGH